MTLLAALLLGAIATLGFAPFGWYPLTLLALLGLGRLWQQARPGRAALLGFAFGFGHFLTGIYWVFISTHVYGGAPLWMGLMLPVLLSMLCALFVALAGLMATGCRAQRQWSWALLQLPTAWLFTELLFSWHPVWSFPWMSLGYAFIDTPLVRMAPLVGVHGMSFAVMFAVGLLLLLLQASGRRLAVLGMGVLGLLLAVLPVPGEWTEPGGEPLPIGLIQPDIPQEKKWLRSTRPEQLKDYRRMSAMLLEDAPDTRLIIWPEVAIPALYSRVRGNYLADLRSWAEQQPVTVLTGLLQKEPGALYNTMRAVGETEGVYRKRHLVPFGEFFPVPDFLRSYLQGLNLDYSDFSHGPALQPMLALDGIDLGISICFEDVFARDIRRELPAAGLLINATNDGWFNRSSAPHQHLQIARMRAVESGRELIRVSNRGVSGRIAVDGTLRESLPMFERGWLTLQAQPYQGLTPYVRWGATPLWVLAVLVFAGIWLGTVRQTI